MTNYDNMREMLRALELAQPHLTVTDQIAKSLETIRGSVLSQSISAAELLSRIKPTLSGLEFAKASALALPDLKMFQINRLLADQMSESFRNLTVPFDHFKDIVAVQQASWITAISESAAFNMSEAVQQALVAQTTSIRSLLDAPNIRAVLAQRDMVAALMRPQTVFADFMRETVLELRKAPTERVASALRAAVNLTQSQLISNDDILSRILRDAEGLPETDIAPAGSLIIPEVQKQELLSSELSIDENDLDATTAASEAATLSSLARRILRLITDCNEAAQLAFGELIFKPTNRVLVVFSQLPWMLPNSRETLGDAVDSLFWMLYEGAGRDKLRFLREGLLKREDCTAIFNIKFLRNKWLRHDPEHGEDSDIRKSSEVLGDVFASLGLRHLPVEEVHFHFLYRRMLEETERFLARLLESLNKFMLERN
jgi:hypothetical protein